MFGQTREQLGGAAKLLMHGCSFVSVGIVVNMFLSVNVRLLVLLLLVAETATCATLPESLDRIRELKNEIDASGGDPKKTFEELLAVLETEDIYLIYAKFNAALVLVEFSKKHPEYTDASLRAIITYYERESRVKQVRQMMIELVQPSGYAVESILSILAKGEPRSYEDVEGSLNDFKKVIEKCPRSFKLTIDYMYNFATRMDDDFYIKKIVDTMGDTLATKKEQAKEFIKMILKMFRRRNKEDMRKLLAEIVTQLAKNSFDAWSTSM